MLSRPISPKPKVMQPPLTEDEDDKENIYNIEMKLRMMILVVIMAADK